jgi:hypothetical protein
LASDIGFAFAARCSVARRWHGRWRGGRRQDAGGGVTITTIALTLTVVPTVALAITLDVLAVVA